MPKGKKKCPECQAIVGAAKKTCSCGFTFSANKKNERILELFGIKKAPTFAECKRSFLKRMLGNQKPSSYALEMSVVKKIFEGFNNDLDFLSKVKPPFQFKNSIKYFLTKEGKEYLLRKYREFYYKPPEKDKFVDNRVKSGEDILSKNIKTLKEFLDE